MKIRAIFVTTLLLALGLHPIAAQAMKRIAITTSNRGKFQDQQNLIATKITSQLAGRSGLTIIDSEQVAQLLKNQDTQNSDRYSPEGAVRIGKLLGAGVLVVVQVDDFSFTPSTKKTFSGSTTTGTVVLQATVRITNMETGVILAQPNASFRDNTELAKTSNNALGTILTISPFPPRLRTIQLQATSSARLSKQFPQTSPGRSWTRPASPRFLLEYRSPLSQPLSLP